MSHGKYIVANVDRVAHTLHTVGVTITAESVDSARTISESMFGRLYPECEILKVEVDRGPEQDIDASRPGTWEIVVSGIGRQ